MSIDVGIEGLTELAARLERVGRGLADRRLLEELSGEAKEMILQRTSEGRDVEGRPFRPYSKGHARARKKKGLGTSRVDLRFSGKMLGGIDTEVDEASGLGRVFFRDGEAETRAGYHESKGAGRTRVRRAFFGLSGDDVERLKGLVRRHVERVIKGDL